MKNNYLYRKVFGLLIVALFAVSCSSNGVAGGPDIPMVDGPVGDDNLPLRKGCLSSKALFSQIDRGSVPKDLSGYDQDSREVFSNYPAEAKVTARYVKENGTGDGSSASKASGNVKTVLDGVTNASANNIYMVLIEPGVYAAKAEMSMKNHVAIIGKCSTGEETIVLSGGGKHRVFNNNGLNRTATLHGVTIANGFAEHGGGMYNRDSSPVLNRVIFSGNTAKAIDMDRNHIGEGGGGMYTTGGSPLLTEVTFSGNRNYGEIVLTDWGVPHNEVGFGGGMYIGSGAPVLNGVTFSKNAAYFGGGLYLSGGGVKIIDAIFSQNRAVQGGGAQVSEKGLAEFIKVIFSKNKAIGYGGGLYNNFAKSSVMINGAFLGNVASWGGGLFHNQTGYARLESVTFEGNRAHEEGAGIYVKGSSAPPVVVNTLLWGNSPDEIGGGSGSREFVFTVSIVRDITDSVNPGLLPFNHYTRGEMVEGAVPTTSSAVDQGLYVRRKAIGYDVIYYYSEDNSTWYRDLDLSVETPLPADAIALTATDLAGAPRIGRPDIGAYEAR